MWKRVQVAGFVILAILASGVWFAGSSQDATEVRLQALEARVSNLEATVNALSPGGGAVSTPIPVTYTIQGEFTLGGTKGDEFYLSSRTGECSGKGGYDDIYVGAQVRVTDESGTLLGIGVLEDGPSKTRCDFVFTVEVPEASFYMVAAGHARRQGPNYSFQEMVDNDWEVSLYMG